MPVRTERRTPLAVHWRPGNALRMLILLTAGLGLLYVMPLPKPLPELSLVLAAPLITLYGLSRWPPWYFSQGGRRSR